MRSSDSLSVLLGSIVVSTIAGGCGGSTDVGASDVYGTSGTPGGGTGSGGAGSGGWTAGTGNGGVSGTVSSGGVAGTPPGYSALPICNESIVALTEGLSPAQPVDYLAVVLEESIDLFTVYQSSGSPCAGAINPQACQLAFASVPFTTGFPKTLGPYPNFSPSPYYNSAYLLFTRGDQVGVIADDAALNQFLGPIDTPNEAVLSIFLHGFPLQCMALTTSAGGGYFASLNSYMPCSSFPPGLTLAVTSSGQVTGMTVGVGPGPCAGRRPTGLCEARVCDDSREIGRYYAQVAYLEAAAVVAFDLMALELGRFGAPAELVARAEQARTDEVRHAALMAALARRHGTEVPALAVAPSRARSLFEMALENVVEGCIRETWGALSAHWQAAMAGDDEARRIWQEIAADETEHAELSLAVHEWIVDRLSVEERALLIAAKERAASDLIRELEREPDVELVRAAGVPNGAVAAKLSRALREQLWARG